MGRIDIIFEDEYILVVNKPAGIGTQAPRPYDSLETRVRHYLEASSESVRKVYLGIPHRIDRCVSGAIVFAKRKKSAQRLAKQFERRQVDKRYVAIVIGAMSSPSGTWQDSMRKVPDQARAELVPADHEHAKSAILHYQVLNSGPTVSRLSIRLETGRMHQIRLQCGARGHAILGDALYGSETAFGKAFVHDRDRQIALHAEELTFEHPRSREQVSFTAPLPPAWTPDVCG